MSFEKTMMPPEEKKPTRQQFPFRLIGIILLWISALYIVFLVMKNIELDSSKPESSRPQTENYQKVCKSPECITLAHELHNWQDISVDPCQDFYQATCGKYNEHSTVNGPKFATKTKIITQLVKEHMEKSLPTDSKSEIAMKVYYEKCKETKKLNATEERVKRMKEVHKLTKSIGSWPMMNPNWKESDFNLNDMLSNIGKLGILNFGFFKLTPYYDVDVDISLTPVIDEFLIYQQTVPEDYAYQFFQDFYTFNNIDKNETLENLTLDSVLDLYETLSLIAEKESISEEKIGFSEIQRNFQSVDFERIIKNLMNPVRKEKVWRNIGDKISAPKNAFIFDETRKLDTVLMITPKRKLADFLMFNLMFNEIEKSFVEKKMLEFVNCEQQVVKVFPLASLRILVRNHFNKDNLEIASKMVEDIRQNFITTLQESTWLHNNTRQKAIKKILQMKKIVGYPEELEKPGALDSFFDSLNLNSDDSYYTIRNKITKFNTERLIDFVGSVFPMQRSSGFFAANAFYSILQNLLILNIPFIDDPFFDSSYPSYAKVASIGEVIGHEIGHGFDPQGRQYDENGKRNNWWTSEDSAEYDRRAQCLVDQYSNHDDPHFGKNLDGTVTIGEMAADLIGINLSWKTYKNLDLSQEPKIIGFEDYNNDKLFFRISALNWCSPRPTNTLMRQLRAVHPINRFRVNGIFSNMESFAKAYNCPIGSPMNPEKKCKLF